MGVKIKKTSPPTPSAEGEGALEPVIAG
jgi:hypothetical protein